MSNSSSSYTDSFVKVDYPAYPSLTPTPAQPAQSGSHSQQQPHYGAAQKHAGSYGSSHGSYMPDYGKQPQQVQEYSASPYQPHGQPTSYSGLQRTGTAGRSVRHASYDAGAYGYQQPAQHTQQAQQQQAVYQQPAAGSHAPPSWQQLQTDAGQATITMLPQGSPSGSGRRGLCRFLHVQLQECSFMHMRPACCQYLELWARRALIMWNKSALAWQFVS